MKLTDDLFKAMLAQRHPHNPKGWRLVLDGLHFDFLPRTDEPGTWAFSWLTGHEYVTELESVLPIIYRLGVKDGEEAVRKHLRKAIGVVRQAIGEEA